MRQESGDRRRLQRIEELRADLNHKTPARVDYARQTLLTMLWLEENDGRQQIINVLCRYLPDESRQPPVFAAQLSAHLGREAMANALAPADAARITNCIGAALPSILNPAVQKLQVIIDGGEANEDDLYRTTDLCRDALTIAARFMIDTVVDQAVRLLRVFPPDQARGVGPLARETGPLREAASHLLGALSPDKLYGYWYALGSPGRTARRDLLPVLDYLQDPSATPYLVRLFERRGQWADSEMVGWFVVRAFKRIRDRRALPALRRVVSLEKSPMLAVPGSQASPDLIREARRAIEAIEYGRATGERSQLLRAAQPPVDHLLHPAQPGHHDLLRPSQRDEQDLIRPADPAADHLVRPASAPTGELLRLVEERRENGGDTLVRWSNEPENPFENFDPRAAF